MDKTTWKEFIEDGKKGFQFLGAVPTKSVTTEKLIKSLDNVKVPFAVTHTLHKDGSSITWKRDHGGFSYLDKKGKVYKYGNFYIIEDGDTYLVYRKSVKGEGMAVAAVEKLTPKEDKHITDYLETMYKDRAGEVKQELQKRGLLKDFIMGQPYYYNEFRSTYKIPALYEEMEKNKNIFAVAAKNRLKKKEPLPGDWVEYNGTLKRIASINDKKGDFYTVQLTDGGSFYIDKNGTGSYSGSLDNPVTGEFKYKGSTKPAIFWTFSGGSAGAGKGVKAMIPVKVWKFKEMKVLR